MAQVRLNTTSPALQGSGVEGNDRYFQSLEDRVQVLYKKIFTSNLALNIYLSKLENIQELHATKAPGQT